MRTITVAKRHKIARPTPRVRFNWGFWDGLSDGRSKRAAVWSRHGRSHFDPVYERGYWAGRAAASDPVDPTSSDTAWEASA